LLLSSLPIAGCGTVANLSKQSPEDVMVPFGGVKQDMTCMKKAAHGEFSFSKHPKSEPKQHPQVAMMLLCAADLPFSAIGDVVTWPYVAMFIYINQPFPLPPVTLPPPGIQAPPGIQTAPLVIQAPPVTQATPGSLPQTYP
jgi:uncharacterized protein YceK